MFGRTPYKNTGNHIIVGHTPKQTYGIIQFFGIPLKIPGPNHSEHSPSHSEHGPSQSEHGLAVGFLGPGGSRETTGFCSHTLMTPIRGLADLFLLP